MSDGTLRIIDANLNRIGEGLRFLEEIARLLLNDTELTQQLKTIRHELLREDISLTRQLLQARNAENDVGTNLQVPGEDKAQQLPLLVVANAKRVQESLRTLEELTKIPGTAPELDSEKFKQARFTLYTIEQQLVAKLLRRNKLERLHGLYVIIDTEALKGRKHIVVARQAIHGGATTIQLRDKISSRKGLLPIARQLRTLCSEHKVLFIVDDYLDIALETDADGLHVGQEDLPIKIARKWLPADKILGGSAETVELALAAQSDGADYIGVGAIYPTLSKVKIGVVGLERLRQIKQAVSLPLVGIGGINKDNAADVIAAGAVSVAVISAISGAESPKEAARQIIASLETK
ncbi:MAG: thiamine phosphate synthase [Dehalococcoidales bacterium]|nr:thiamine phosphate synthase [Dehalococcoidales bacterium]